MSNTLKLNGKIALVTGGATGIGYATAKAFVEEGAAAVFITGRREVELFEAARRLGPKVIPVRADSSKLADLDRVFAEIKARSGRLDVVFANAGGGSFAALGDITEEHYYDTFDRNVKGVIFTVQKALPLLAKGASIILNASTTSISGSPAFSIYSASKAAVRNLARSWILDLKGKDIRVNVLSPGPTRTEGVMGLAGAAAQGEAFLSALAEQSPSGRVGDASEIGKVAVFLASEDSSYVNGVELFVDGGFAQT